MKQQKIRYPKLRFKDFSGEWEQRKLGELFSERTERSNNGKFEMLSVTINSGIVKANTLIRRDNSSKEKSNYKCVYPKDIAYNSMRMWQGASGVSAFKGIVSPAYTVLKPAPEVDTYFFAYLFKKNSMIQMFQKNSQGLTSDTWNLKYPQLSSIRVKVPIFREQKTIGHLFIQLDKLIASNQRKVEKFKELKKGYLQKLFPKSHENVPELRFPGFTNAWEQRKLGDMADFNPKSVLPETFEYVDLESVVGTDIISHRLEHKDNAPSRAQRLAQKGDVFYQTVRPYQKNNCIFDKLDNNWVFSTGYAQLRPKKDSYFLLVSLQNNSFIRKVLDRCTGTSYPAINSKDLAQIEVVISDSIGEQKKVGSLFHSIDKTITLHQHKLDKLKELKKAYLQKMFC